MTAGMSATIVPLGKSTKKKDAKNQDDWTLPFRPRVLTTNERQQRDLYVFYSPRNHRVVQVVEAINFALSLNFDFNPRLECYVERPRRINLTAKRQIDISFWTRDLEGKESFYLTIPASETIPAYGGDVVACERDLIDDAAKRHGIKIEYIFERDLVRHGDRLSLYFRLLPFVQSTRRIVCRSLIRDGIKEYFDAVPRASCHQLQQALPKYDRNHVQAVAAAMVHSGYLTVDNTSIFTLNTMLEREKAHAHD